MVGIIYRNENDDDLYVRHIKGGCSYKLSDFNYLPMEFAKGNLEKTHIEFSLFSSGQASIDRFLKLDEVRQFKLKELGI